MRLNPPACDGPKPLRNCSLQYFDLCMKIIAPTSSLACRNRNANVDQRLSGSTQTRELGVTATRVGKTIGSSNIPLKHYLYVDMSSPTECITPGLKARAEQRKNLSDFPII